MSALQILWLAIMWVALGAGVWLTRVYREPLWAHVWARVLLLVVLYPVACAITLGVVFYP